MYWAFEVLITVLLKIYIFWEVTPCRWVCSFQCFKRIVAPPSGVFIPKVKKCSKSGIEICTVLGYYAVYSGIVILTFQDNVPLSSLFQEDFLIQKNSDIICFTVEA
jgi:hypothetical protein